MRGSNRWGRGESIDGRRLVRTEPTTRAPPRQPQPGELLFEFYIEPKKMRVRCELRTHPQPYGVEAQFFENEVFMIGRRFDRSMGGTLTPREMAVQWATEWRRGIETEEA